MSGRTYQLAARDNTGVFLGLGAVECALVGAGFVGTISMRLLGVPVIPSTVPIALAATVAKAMIGGKPLHEWVRLSIAWSWTSAMGRHRWQRALPLLPESGDRRTVLPPALAGIDIIELPGTERIAAVRDRRRARLTAVFTVRTRGFVGADPSAQEALLARWGDVLAAQADSGHGVVQVGWSHEATPTDLEEHRWWCDDRLPEGSADADQYRALIDEVAATASRRTTYVWITVSGRDIGGQGRLIDRATAQLPSVVDSVADRLADGGVLVEGPLTVPELWRLLRRRCDPCRPPATVDHTGPSGSLAQRMGLVAPTTGSPLALDVDWSGLRIDGGLHRLYWVESWPRRPVPADWLAGFLAGFESAAMTVSHRPVDPARSQRRIDSQLVKISAHLARKEDRSRRVTEVERRVQDAAENLESEIASGFAETLYIGLVCVSASTEQELEDRCNDIEQAARVAQLGLRVIHGRQDFAWVASLPFGQVEPSLLDLVGP